MHGPPEIAPPEIAPPEIAPPEIAPLEIAAQAAVTPHSGYSIASHGPCCAVRPSQHTPAVKRRKETL